MTAIFGTDGIDFMNGTSGDDLIFGYGGDDNLWGGEGNDLLQGGAGADRLDGSDGIDMVDYNGTVGVWVDLQTGYGYGGEAQGDRLLNIENVQATNADDWLFGSWADNALYGFSGNDNLVGRDGNDNLVGMGGNDFLQGGAGADDLNGGGGFDTVDYNGDAGVVVDLGTGIGRGGEAEGDRLIGIENVRGTNDYGDGLSGNDAANVLSGFGGDDWLDGGRGDDILLGGNGDDYLHGGAGADQLDGGDGSQDTVTYSDSSAGIGIDLGLGTGSGGDAEGDILSGIENAQGTDYTDGMIGSDADNIFYGGLGGDALSGQGGDDTLVSGGSVGLYDDYDYLDGGDGNDILEGGGDTDQLIGGAGADSFRYVDISDSQGNSVDQIADFSQADGDRIDLAVIDASTWYDGDQAFTFIGGSAFTGFAGQLRAEVIGSDTVVSADVDGDARADLTIICNGVVSLTMSDFVL